MQMNNMEYMYFFFTSFSCFIWSLLAGILWDPHDRFQGLATSGGILVLMNLYVQNIYLNATTIDRTKAYNLSVETYLGLQRDALQYRLHLSNYKQGLDTIRETNKSV